MAERIKDKDDLALETIFRSEPLPDGGFSAKVVSRVQRRVWVRRLALPTALVIGLAISAKSLLQLINAISGIVNAVFGSALSIDRLPFAAALQPSTVLVGASILMVALLVGRVLEE
jgi:thiol:disulfide interchange protein